MARSMRILLIRHGETIDNVAQLYAGSRDSALTNHGYQQATRLGLHLKALGWIFTHLFSSHLQRAVKTADLIREAQLGQTDDTEAARDVPDVVQLRSLMEQDFGDLEGKKWTDIQAESQNRPGFVGVESKEAMARRANTFLDEHLLPLICETIGNDDLSIAIVSHGIFLSTLWKRLLSHLPAKSITLSPDLQSTVRASLEHLGGWSNTGYLEVHMVQGGVEESAPAADAVPSPTSKVDLSHPVKLTLDDLGVKVDVIKVAARETGDIATSQASLEDSAKPTDPTPAPAARVRPTMLRPSGTRSLHGWTTTIITINGKDHLKGFKRTGGGVGSSRHDASQKSIESFFKRRKVE